MPYEITVADIRDGFTTSASDTEIQAYITVVDTADECLAANEVPEAVGQRLKVLAVRHMLLLVANDGSGGTITSQRAVSGASRTLKQPDVMEGTHYATLLKQLDRWGCVWSVIQNNASFSIMSIGRRSDRTSDDVV